MALIAGRTPLKESAANLLSPHSREWFLSEIPWRHFESTVAKQPLDGLTPHDAVERSSFVFRIANGTSIPAFSILGERIEVPAESRISHLLVGRPSPPGGHGKTYVRLRKIDGEKDERVYLRAIVFAFALEKKLLVALRGGVNFLVGDLKKKINGLPIGQESVIRIERFVFGECFRK